MSTEYEIKKTTNVFKDKSIRTNSTLIIHKNKLQTFKDKIEKVNKKRERLIKRGRIPEDTPEFLYSVNNIKEESEYEKIFSDSNNIFINGTHLSQNINGKKEINSEAVKEFAKFQTTFLKHPSFFIHIDLKNTKIPNLDDWQIIGLLSPLEENSDLYKVSETTDIPLPEKYKKLDEVDPCNCDHCKKSRKRNNTFILLNQKTNETIQVGGDCLKDFIKKENVNQLMLFNDVMEILSDFKGGREEYQPVIDKEEYLSTVSKVIRLDGGYVSRNKSFYTDKYTTNEIATYVCDEYLFHQLLEDIRRSGVLRKATNSEIKKEIEDIKKLIDKYREPNKEDFENANAVIKKYESIDKEKISKLDNFHFNIYTAIANNSDVLIGSSKNIVSYSIQEYLVEKEKIKNNIFRKNEIFEKPTYIANPKDKIEEIELKFIKVRDGYSYYGYTEQLFYKFNFKTLDGRDVYFKTTAELPDFLKEENGYYLSPQEMNEKLKDKFLKIKGSIKDNTKFETDNDDIIKRTTLTRVSFLEDPTDKPTTDGLLTVPNFLDQS